MVVPSLSSIWLGNSREISVAVAHPLRALRLSCSKWLYLDFDFLSGISQPKITSPEKWLYSEKAVSLPNLISKWLGDFREITVTMKYLLRTLQPFCSQWWFLMSAYPSEISQSNPYEILSLWQRHTWIVSRNVDINFDYIFLPSIVVYSPDIASPRPIRRTIWANTKTKNH